MNLKQHKFVTEYLRFGDQCIAYKNAYNSTATGKTIEGAANRLMKYPEVAQAIADAQATIREKVEKEVAGQLKGELLTVQKKRELLYQIATGEMHVLQYHKGKDCNTCTQYVTPTINQMLRAIHLDNKLAGHNPQIHKLSPAGGGVRLSADGGGTLTQEKQTIKNHNKTQQLSSSCPSKNGEPDSASCDNQEKPTHKKHNNSQQFSSSCHAELDSASHETQDNPHKTITQHQLNTLLNTAPDHTTTPRILQFRRRQELTEYILIN